MTAVLLPNGKQQYFTTAGLPAVGYKIATFDAGTSNPRTTWADALKIGANANPVILDARGEASIFWEGAYKVQLQDSTGAVIWTQDNLQSQPNGFTSSLVPAVTNTIDLGSTILSWRNVYVGANNAPILDTVTGAVGYFPRTAAEITAGVTPTSFSVPSHAITGEIYPERYGAKADGATDDTAALNNAFLVGQTISGEIVLPTGTCRVGALLFGQNNTGLNAQSAAPTILRGTGSVLKAIAGFTGTILSAKNCAGLTFNNFIVDGNNGSGTAAVCIDTSWPNSTGTTNINSYDSVVVQNFTQNGWLGINDNQSKWKDCTARGASGTGLSGMRIEGQGGSFSLDNVIVSDSFLSICCQNCDVRGGFFKGLRVNESQVGVNYIYLSSCQIYVNPTTLTHFEDASYNVAGHVVSSLVMDSVYLLSATGSSNTNTINCGVAGKIDFRGCTFINGSSGTWNLYGPHAFQSANPQPSIVSFDGGSTGVLQFNTPTGFITEIKDVSSANAPAGVHNDYPMRVTYRSTFNFPAGLVANTPTNIVPANSMVEDGASYIVSVYVNATGADNLACSAFVAAVARQAAVGPTAAIAQGTTANTANNLVNAISLRYGISSNVGGVNQAGIDASINIALANGSSISVTLIRLANPTLNY